MNLPIGTIDRANFAQVFARTAPHWRRLAKQLFRRWNAGNSIDVEDVVQVMMLGVWEACERFDGGRGPSRERFLTWEACYAAKREIHRARKALRLSDKSPSRIAESLDESGRVIAADGSGDEVLSISKIVREALDSTEAIVIAVYCVEGTAKGAAAKLWSDEGLRTTVGAQSSAEAHRMVARVIENYKETCQC